MKKDTRRGKAGQSGQALVEFAIIVPLLLMLLMGLMEWGFLLWSQTMFVNAVRDGSRSAVVVREWNTNTVSKQEDIKNIVIERLQSLPASITSGITNNITVELLPSSANVASVKVSIVSQPYDPIIDFAGFLTPDSLSASAEFRYEGG